MLATSSDKISPTAAATGEAGSGGPTIARWARRASYGRKKGRLPGTYAGGRRLGGGWACGWCRAPSASRLRGRVRAFRARPCCLGHSPGPSGVGVERGRGAFGRAFRGAFHGAFGGAFGGGPLFSHGATDPREVKEDVGGAAGGGVRRGGREKLDEATQQCRVRRHQPMQPEVSRRGEEAEEFPRSVLRRGGGW